MDLDFREKPDAGTPNVRKTFLCSHVTALQFISDFLLVGKQTSEGNRISLYNWRTKELLEEIFIFQQSAVHGIRIGNDNMEKTTVLFYGAKCFKLYSFASSKKIRFEVIDEERHMNDWIHDAQILSFDASVNSLVSFVLAHNCVSVWNCKEKKEEKRISCQLNCILYSAKIIVNNINAFILAVGTVFKEILIWSPNSKLGETKMPLHQLIGHQGVIFSITYSSEHKLLCSTSDDRSLRLWKISSTAAVASDNTLQFWEESTINIIHVLYAHESRVWMSVILRNCVISVGEDSNICFWNFEGKLLKKGRGHKDGSIWCIAVNAENEVAATGGSDGGLCLWNISNSLLRASSSHITLHHKPTDQSDFPRVICLFTKDVPLLLVTTDRGCLSLYFIKCKKWKDLVHDSSLISYCVPSISPNGDLISLGNIHGDIIFITSKDSFRDHCDLKKFKVHSSKINNIHWVEKKSEYVLTCGQNGHMVLWKLAKHHNELDLICIKELYLPESKRHWWSTAAVFIMSHKCLVVGDRSGNINSYPCAADNDDNSITLKPNMTYKGIHGDNGVTTLKEHKEFIYSAGRDGRVLQYEIVKGSIQLLHSIKVPHNLEWIGGIEFYDDDILLLGFHTTNFIVWNSKYENTVMNVDCGGGHRSWDFLLDKNGNAIFAAIKKKDIMLTSENLSFKLNESSLKVGISGREFCQVLFLFSTRYRNKSISIVAVGGEENSLKIFGLFNNSSTSTSVIPLQNLSGHISSIKSMAKCEMKEKNSFLLVSVGGRAQMMIWKIKKNDEITCQELASDILDFEKKKSKKPWKESMDCNVNSQIRYMDVVVFLSNTSPELMEEYCIATASSDGFLRLHNYNVTTQRLTLRGILQNGEHCLLKLARFQVMRNSEKKNIFVTGATDGNLRIFGMENVDSSLEMDMKNKFKKSPCRFEANNSGLALKVPLHQSGINALDVKCLLDESYIIGTGGDDNTLSFVLVQFPIMGNESKETVKVVAKGSIKQAHASQITGLKFLGSNTIVSVSIDQRVNIWNWTSQEASNVIDIQLKTSKLSFIPDVAHLDAWENECVNSFSAIVCGEGIECFHFESIT